MDNVAILVPSEHSRHVSIFCHVWDALHAVKESYVQWGSRCMEMATRELEALLSIIASPPSAVDAARQKYTGSIQDRTRLGPARRGDCMKYDARERRYRRIVLRWGTEVGEVLWSSEECRRSRGARRCGDVEAAGAYVAGMWPVPSTAARSGIPRMISWLATRRPVRRDLVKSVAIWCKQRFGVEWYDTSLRTARVLVESGAIRSHSGRAQAPTICMMISRALKTYGGRDGDGVEDGEDSRRYSAREIAIEWNVSATTVNRCLKSISALGNTKQGLVELWN